MNRNQPVSLVTTDCINPVELSLKRTFASEMGVPDASSILPLIEPVPTCAEEHKGQDAIRTTARNKFFTENVVSAGRFSVHLWIDSSARLSSAMQSPSSICVQIVAYRE